MHVPGLPNHKSQSQEITQAPRHTVSSESTGQGTASRRASRHDSPSHTRSADMVRLAAELSRTPEIRGEKVAQAIGRLASCYYVTREAAEATAEQLLKEPD